MRAKLLPLVVLPAAVLAGAGKLDNDVIQLDGLRQQEAESVGRRSGTLYTIDLLFGTPGQPVPVKIDTGSSELWTNPVCSKSSAPNFCSTMPRFTRSGTLIDLGQQGHISWARGNADDGYVDFQYEADYVGIGSAKVTQQILVSHTAARGLWWQGIIHSRAFSLDLRGLGSSSGAVIFGGIDTKKYAGELVRLPIVPAGESPDGMTGYWVHLDGVIVNQADGTVVNVYQKQDGENGQVVRPDSGSPLSALPTAIFVKFMAAFPSAEYIPNPDLYSVDCFDLGQGGSVDFTFAGKVINVPYHDFVLNVPDSDGCMLGAYEDSFAVLGDTFLRAAYVVFDWDNRSIYLAQSEECGSNLVAIGKDPDAVPSITGECSPRATSSTSAPTSTASSITETTTSTTDSATSTTETTPPRTFTYTTHKIVTLTSCPPSVPSTDCPASGSGGRKFTTVLTEVVTATTSVCTQTTGVYIIPGGVGTTGPALTVNVTPVEPRPTPVVVPGCTEGAPVPTGARSGREGDGSGSHGGFGAGSEGFGTAGSGSGSGRWLGSDPSNGSGSGSGSGSESGSDDQSGAGAGTGSGSGSRLTTPATAPGTARPTHGLSVSGGSGSGNTTAVATTAPKTSIVEAGASRGVANWAAAALMVGPVLVVTLGL
ncbi:Aspartic peptidase domain-containing protein [Madurella fahalii]|uniref:Aspartic peptidase domain-containing protein n=1 Tax=Madurella fahalii TaxID=1157608 RepID=A0ABQ0GT43_9PEZI